MAEVVGVINSSHVWIEYPPRSQWSAIRESRDFLPDVPNDDEAAQLAKEAWIRAAVGTLRARLQTLNPDVLVVFGDDQSENFDPNFSLVPSLAVFAGPQFAGHPYDDRRGGELRTVRGHPALAEHILDGLLAQDFDPAFCLGLPNPAHGIGHAIMNPLGYFTDYQIPTVPILINALFAPQVTARRAYRLGSTIKTLIESFPENLRVVGIGSGGLWHTGNSAPATYLDEEFDHVGLRYLEKGDIAGWARHFDGYRVPADDRSQDISERNRVATGLRSPSGPQYGTRETLNWIAASALRELHPFTVVDYIPLYCSPIGCTFVHSS